MGKKLGTLAVLPGNDLATVNHYSFGNSMKLKLLTLATVTVVGTLLPSVARAVQWVEVGESYRATLYLDVDSVKHRGNMVQFWDQVVLKQPDEKGITSIKQLNSLNCTTANYNILREVTYIAGQVRSDTKVTWKETQTTIPGSLSEFTFRRVCRR